jgi:hypothetical protein
VFTARYGLSVSNLGYFGMPRVKIMERVSPTAQGPIFSR